MNQVNQVYTKINGAYVMPEPGDINSLQLESCVVARDKGKLFVYPIGERIDKDAERGNDFEYDAIFGSVSKNSERYMIVNGQRVERKFCNFCKDRLNGITGNCFDYKAKPGGCKFKPSVEIKPFNISLQGYTKLKPSDTSRHSPFQAPYSPGEAFFDEATYRRNKKMRVVRRNLWDYAERKKKKYCSNCIYEGLCWLNTRKVVEHCMMTHEKTMKDCLSKLVKHYGSVSEFLTLLSYSGGVISYRPKGAKRRTNWRISRPLNRKRFVAIKTRHPWSFIELTRQRVERFVRPEALPKTNHELLAALAWFFMKRYCEREGVTRVWAYRGRTMRPLWVLPKKEGIEITHYPWGWRLRQETILLKSFNEILRYER